MPHPRLRPLALLAVVLALVAGAVYWGLSALAPEVEPDRAETMPAGRWHRQPAARRAAEEEARLLSLPYSAGGARATGRSGVVFHDPERAAPGLNLYSSGHGPEAILVDMAGRALHRWRYPFERAFPERRPIDGTEYWRRARALPDGGLLAIYQGGGMVRLDRGSRLVWTADGTFYNDFFIHPSGRIWTLTKEAIRPPDNPENPEDAGEPMLEDSLVVLSGDDGRELSRLSLLDAMRRSRFAALLEPMKGQGDVLHSNAVEVLDGRFADRSPLFAAGNVLISLREVDLLLILDPDGPQVLWAQRGPWNGQHQPTMVEPGRILLFDNRGWHGRSRAIEYDPLSGEIAWQYAADPPELFSSPQAGAVQRLPGGTTLVTESERGRAFEVTREGEIVWELLSPHRAGANGELVATLFEVIRLPTDFFVSGFPASP